MKSVFLTLLILLCLSLQAADLDSCDEIRDRNLCSASPATCYWDSSKEKIGHACVKFSYSGECNQIPADVDDDCTGAGQGLLCDTYMFPNGSKICFSKCSRWNQSSSYCEGGTHFYCRYTSSSGCLSCPELSETECNASLSYCRWNGSACGLGCRTLSIYNGYSDYDCQTANDSCFYDYDSNICLNFESCTKIGDLNGFPSTQQSCNQAHKNCTYDMSGGGPPYAGCIVDTLSCSSYNQVQCAADNKCYYNSSQDLCLDFDFYYGWQNTSECGMLSYPSDCATAYWNSAGTYKGCVWKDDQIGCVSKCTDFPRVVTTDISSFYVRTDCKGRSDCWWDPFVVIVGGSNDYFRGCEDFSGTCSTLYDQNICSEHSAMCYWNNTNTLCSNYEYCSEISEKSPCETTSRCKWNDTACLDKCGQITNEHDCLDRPDCRYDQTTPACVDFFFNCGSVPGGTTACNGWSNCWYRSGWGCVSYDTCKEIRTMAACNHPSKRCSWNIWGECLDEIYSPEIDENRKGCSAYSKEASCNADSVTATTDGHVGCVWNGRVCVNFTTCESISYLDFGGNFTDPSTSCVSKKCSWKTPEYSSGSCWLSGWCVAYVDGCRDHITAAACNAATGGSISENENGCYWDSREEVCNEFSCYGSSEVYCNAAISNGRKCEWDDKSWSCKPLCSRHSTVYGCEKDYNDCYWDTDAGACTFLETPSDIKRPGHCTLYGGVWVATDALNLSVGNCFEEYEAFNLQIRGCDDYLNAEQCGGDTVSVARRTSNDAACGWIWNVDRTSGKCILWNTTASDFINCSEYQNKDQCVYATDGSGIPLCFWKSSAPDGQHCHQHSECSDVPLEDCDSAYLCAKRNRTASEVVCESYTVGSSSFCNEYNNSQEMCEAHLACEYYSPAGKGSYCDSIDCSGFTRNDCEKHSSKCVWRKYFDQFGGTCTYAYVKEKDIENTLSYQLNLDYKCSNFDSDTVGCNQNDYSCALGCVYNSRSNLCINFRNCSDIAFPYFQDPQRDCDAKQPFCFWNSGECSTIAPPEEEKKKKLSAGAIAGIVVGSVFFVLIVVAIIVILLVLYRKKRVAAASDNDTDDDRKPLRNEESNREETQAPKQAQAQAQEQAQEQAQILSEDLAEEKPKVEEIEPTDGGDSSGLEGLQQEIQ